MSSTARCACSACDRDLLYPILERCQKLGVKVVAVHKAMPLGAVAMDPFKNSDVDYAAIDFPDRNFEGRSFRLCVPR